MGDPYFRDSLLQSAQLPVLPDICLPVKIDSITIYHRRTAQSDSVQGVTTVQNRAEKEVIFSVLGVNEYGQVIERLEGYMVRIMEHHPEYPTPEEIANPALRDETTICNETKRIFSLFDVNIIGISADYIPSLQYMSKENKHRKELPVFKRAVQNFFVNNEKKETEIDITWHSSGKPVLQGEENSAYDISLSMTEGRSYVFLGKGRRGVILNQSHIELVTSGLPF